MNLKLLYILAPVLLISIISKSQDNNRLTVSLAAGKFGSPYFDRNVPKGFFTIDFDYHLSKNQSIVASYNSGKHDYYEDDISPSNGIWLLGALKNSGTNSEATYRTFSVMYKYRIFLNDHFSIAAGTGAGAMTRGLKYPYVTANSSTFAQSSGTSLVFPVRLELDYKLIKSLNIGLISGFFIDPDFPIVGYHIGPRLSYTLK